jgi:hypothetical protein
MYYEEVFIVSNDVILYFYVSLNIRCAVFKTNNFLSMLSELRVLYYELKKKVNEIQHQKDLIIQKNGGGIYLMKIKKSLES